MIRAIALPVMFLISAMMALAADQSSNSDEPGEFDIEPPILKQNLSDELAEAGTPDGNVARCEKKLERAKRNAGRAQDAEELDRKIVGRLYQTPIQLFDVRHRRPTAEVNSPPPFRLCVIRWRRRKRAGRHAFRL